MLITISQNLCPISDIAMISEVFQTLPKSAYFLWQAVLVQVDQPLEEAWITQQLLCNSPGWLLLQQGADCVHDCQNHVWGVSVDPKKLRCFPSRLRNSARQSARIPACK